MLEMLLRPNTHGITRNTHDQIAALRGVSAIPSRSAHT